MKKRTIVLFCAGLLTVGALCGLVACSQPAQESTDAAKQAADISYTGNALVVTLEANATTGYEWTQDLAGEGLKLVSDEYIAAETAGDVAGAGGVHVFTYEGTGQGDSTITFKYARNWESSDSDQELVVAVKTGSDGTIESAVEK